MATQTVRKSDNSEAGTIELSPAVFETRVKRDLLHAEVRRRGLAGRVDFYERINRKEVNAVFNRAHANLLISRKEGASKILYEGLAAGTPLFGARCTSSSAARAT